MPERLGVFGGTFDPIHIGHLIIAQEACERLALDRVLFVPARVSPLKQDGTMFTPEQRLEMTRAAVEPDPRFVCSTLDIERPGPSYTVDTLRLLHDQFQGKATLHFVLGADSLLAFAHWYRPNEIIRLARLAVHCAQGGVLRRADVVEGIVRERLVLRIGEGIEAVALRAVGELVGEEQRTPQFLLVRELDLAAERPVITGVEGREC